MIGSVAARDATPNVSRDPVGHDYIRVGEASIAIDPLSSQGIQTALLSAVQGSAAVHTILTAGYDPLPAVEFYRERQLPPRRGTRSRRRVSIRRFLRSAFSMRRSRAAWTRLPMTGKRKRPTYRPLACAWLGSECD